MVENENHSIWKSISGKPDKVIDIDECCKRENHGGDGDKHRGEELYGMPGHDVMSSATRELSWAQQVLPPDQHSRLPWRILQDALGHLFSS